MASISQEEGYFLKPKNNSSYPQQSYNIGKNAIITYETPKRMTFLIPICKPIKANLSNFKCQQRTIKCAIHFLLINETHQISTKISFDYFHQFIRHIFFDIR